jgi:hypothetical protein
MCSVRNDFEKFFIQEFSPEQLLDACRLEDIQKTSEAEKNNLLLALEYYFHNIPFWSNGRLATRDDIMYAAFFYVSASPLVRKWIEERGDNFGISLILDLECRRLRILCSDIDEWKRINDLVMINGNKII